MSKIEAGCLAQITKLDSLNYGKIVAVVERYDGRVHPNGFVYCGRSPEDWIVQAGNLVVPRGFFAGEHVAWHVVESRFLRRIDNPGDDAQDLLLAPLPEKETA